MFAEERQAQVARLVTDQGRVSVAQLSTRFDITMETVRRDLAALEKEGRLRRVHGGAVPADRVSTKEQSLISRQTQRLKEKSAIARAALDLVPESGSVILDAGTTTEQLAALLAERSDESLLVITHAIPIANLLSGNSAVELELLGGRVRGLTRAAVGPATVAQLERLRPDVAFVGANGLHSSFGLSTPDALEAAVKSAIVRSARRVVVLVDSSKLEEETLVRFAALEDIDAVVTNEAPTEVLAKALAEADVEVVLA